MNTYRIETKDKDGVIIDYIDIETVEPLLRADDVSDELNLETNEHIKRVGQVTLDGSYPKYWHVDTSLSNETHVVAYLEDTDLLCLKNKPFTDTDRSMYLYGDGTEEYDTTTCIWTEVRIDGTSRIYVRLPKEEVGIHSVYTSDIINDYFISKPVKVNYALRYPVVIPRSMSKGHLLTLGGQTDITLTTTSEQAKLPIMKFNIGDKQYTLDNNPIHINNTQEGTQIRNIVLEGNTPINYARGNGVNTTEQVSDTRYDFEPFYDGQATIQGTVEGGYVSAKLYGDTMVNIAKSYGESPLLTATNESASCDDLLGMNEEGIVLADGEITEGRIYGDSFKLDAPVFQQGYGLSTQDGSLGSDYSSEYYTDLLPVPINPFTFGYGYEDGSSSKMYAKVVFYDKDGNFISGFTNGSERKILDITSIPTNATQIRYGMANSNNYPLWKYKDGTDVYNNIQSVVNPTVLFANHPFIFGKGGRL